MAADRNEMRFQSGPRSSASNIHAGLWEEPAKGGGGLEGNIIKANSPVGK